MKHFIFKVLILSLYCVQNIHAQNSEAQLKTGNLPSQGGDVSRQTGEISADQKSSESGLLDRVLEYFHINPEKLDSQKVLREIELFKKVVATRRKNFAAEYPEDFESRNWIKLKIKFLRDLDIELAKFLAVPKASNYSDIERSFFQLQTKDFKNKFYQENANQLREIIQRVGWPIISLYGAYTDNQAFMIVLHADVDPEFQKEILKMFLQFNEQAKRTKQKSEIRAENYAYLEDRIAASRVNLKLQRPQNYGSSGVCIAKGQWQAYPIADIKNLEVRREQFGLESFSEYQRKANEACL